MLVELKPWQKVVNISDTYKETIYNILYYTGYNHRIFHLMPKELVWAYPSFERCEENEIAQEHLNLLAVGCIDAGMCTFASYDNEFLNSNASSDFV